MVGNTLMVLSGRFFAHAELGQTDRAMELFSIINPINHARSEIDAVNYRVEPYVIAADVYSVAPNVGRGGWTWYTGSAGWMYRAGLEAILGISREGNLLRVKPCVPDDWNEFEVKLQFGATRYEIKLTRHDIQTVQTSHDIQTLSLHEFLIALKDEGGIRQIILPLSQAPFKTKKDGSL